MFAILMSAGKRLFDLTLAPILMSVVAIFLELTLALPSWLLVQAGNLLINIFATLLSLIPSPLQNPASVLPDQVLQLASASGFWPALGVVLLGGAFKLILTIITVGIIR